MRMSTVFKKRDFSHLIIKVDTQKTKIGYKPNKWWSTSILYMKFTYYIETYFWQRKKIIVKFDIWHEELNSEKEYVAQQPLPIFKFKKSLGM